ncbi:phage tail tape measure protein [Pseudomonas plecoglossicida]|uniref:phage tail tape measure protein n=1 Tax=Pseudomonas plecoglossicida TaxID=70775 RepID=UPI003D19CF3D
MADKFQLKALITGVDKLSPTLAGIRKNVSSFQKGLEKTGLGKIGFRDLIAGGAIAAPFVAGINKAIEFESQMADVKKVVDFDTPQQFREMSEDIGRMSERLPMAAGDIAKIVAAGGQSGIAKSELLGFAEAAVKMGVAFDQTADQSGEMMAKWRTSFKMGQDDVVALADKINYLGNTGPANTRQISDIVTRIGPLGEIAGLASGQIAALGATMAGVGVEQEVAATGIKNFMLAMTKGSAATKSQAEAFKALRLDSKAVATAMQKDAQGAVLDILDRIKAVDKDKQAGLMTNLFGSESITAIAPLLTNLDLLKGNLQKVADEKGYSGSMDKEYASRAATTANNLQLLRNTIDSVGRALGNALLPGLNEVVGSIRPLITYTAAMIEANPNLVRGIVGATLAFTGIRAAILAATVATKVMGVALAASPIGLIAVGIAAAAGLIIANWETVGPFFSALWDLIKAYTVPAWEMFKAFAAWTPLGFIIKNWEPIAGFFKDLWASVSKYIEPIMKFMGLDEGGEGITAKVQRAANAQSQRNGEAVGAGDGALLAANAGSRQQAMSAAMGIPSTGQLLKTPVPGSLVMASNKAQVSGELNININGAPPGTRVEQAKTNQPGLQVRPNVGYRTMGAASA